MVMCRCLKLQADLGHIFQIIPQFHRRDVRDVPIILQDRNRTLMVFKEHFLQSVNCSSASLHMILHDCI